MKISRWLLAATLTSALCAHAQFITPGSNLTIEGIPPIPEHLVKKVSAYTEFRPAGAVAWHPGKPGMLVRMRLTNTNQLHWVSGPGVKPEPLTDYPDAVTNGTYQPLTGEYLIFGKGSGGNEVSRLHRLDFASKEITPISPENEVAAFPSWNRKGDRIVYTATTIDRFNKGEGAERMATMRVIIVDPKAPASARTVATFEGGRYSGPRFSPDEKTILLSEYVSANESHLWLMDAETGSKRRLTPAPKAGEATVSYAAARFARDGKGVYATSDRDSEFHRLVHIDLATGKETVLTGHLDYDVSEFTVSTRANRIAFTTNESGSSVLRLLDFTTRKELPRPALLPGEISGLRWSGRDEGIEGDDKGTDEPVELAFSLTSARSPGDVYALNISNNKIMRWTNGAVAGSNTFENVEPRLVKWTSFDGLAISGFLYQPDAKKFPGKRPVIINIHGGPEGQARPGFIGRNNYMINELGLAMIYPNVRGSSGFGKTFLALDNGMKREDSVKDIGALFDWIKEQPDLDAGRVLVMGGSYGGYMVLAVSTHYADRIAGAIDIVGISNWITFLANTESYRRDLRRVEYGDEREPEMRKFLEKISPLNNAGKIRKPLFVIQGRNDPRVPYTEALQIVAQLKKQMTPVWFLMAADEGHGFARKANQDFQFYAVLAFLEETLLKPAAATK